MGESNNESERKLSEADNAYDENERKVSVVLSEFLIFDLCKIVHSYLPYAWIECKEQPYAEDPVELRARVPGFPMQHFLEPERTPQCEACQSHPRFRRVYILHLHKLRIQCCSLLFCAAEAALLLEIDFHTFYSSQNFGIYDSGLHIGENSEVCCRDVQCSHHFIAKFCNVDGCDIRTNLRLCDFHAAHLAMLHPLG